MSATAELRWLEPDWDIPGIRALSTLRPGGASRGPYNGLNLALHVGDDPARVEDNRRLLRQAAGLPAEPLWLEQVHGSEVAVHRGPVPAPRADAAVAFEPGHVCAVMTADCLPVVFADLEGGAVGVAHAGWRGLAAGVLEATVAALSVPPGRLAAWLAPAISQAAFEVGEEVRAAFLRRSADFGPCFQPNARGRLQADLYELARRELRRLGVGAVSGGGHCTLGDPERYYSYRRQAVTGRMATLAWIAPAA
jgi:YfiH family protein